MRSLNVATVVIKRAIGLSKYCVALHAATLVADYTAAVQASFACCGNDLALGVVDCSAAQVRRLS